MAVGLRVADVTDEGPLLVVILRVPAEGGELVDAIVVDAADERVDAGDGAADEDAALDHCGGVAVSWRRAGLVVGVAADVRLEAAICLLAAELRVVDVEDIRPVRGRAPLEDAHEAVAGVRAAAGENFQAVGRARAGGDAGAAVVVPAVGAEFLRDNGRLEVRVAEGDAHRLVGGLVDVGHAGAIAGVLRVRAEIRDRVGLTAKIEGDDAPAERERAHGPQVDGARETLADKAGVRGLVDGDAVDEFGRILVELDAAVVARADLFATIEERISEVRRETAHGDDLRAARDTLGGEAGEARDRLRDGNVGQLADVFGGNRFDDRGRLLLGEDGALNAAADAGDHEGIELDGFILAVGFGGLGLREHIQGRLRKQQAGGQTSDEDPAHGINMGVVLHGG